jgi:hypothetical protein
MRLGALLLLIPALAYVLPAPRALEQIGKAGALRGPISLVVRVEGVDPTWPGQVTIDVHPREGVRVDDGRGGRWVVRGGRVVGASTSALPAWLPQLEVLAFSSAEALTSWLQASGVDVEVNELGRCGAEDCFVIGGRQGAAQLWVEKDRFEARRWVSGLGRSFEFGPYATFGNVKFPSKIEIFETEGRLATLTVSQLSPASTLGPADFSPRWASP